MGTDIHLYAEVQKKDGTWRPAQGLVKNYEDSGPDVPTPDKIYSDRNYDVFGWLAGVRGNGTARFARRGLPHDVCPETKAIFVEDGGHSESWLNVGEVLRALHAKKATVRVSGMMDRARLAYVKREMKKGRTFGDAVFDHKAKNAGSPSYCAWGSSPELVPFEFDLPLFKHYAFERFYKAMLRAAEFGYWGGSNLIEVPKERVAELEDLGIDYASRFADRVRVVFWFDS